MFYSTSSTRRWRPSENSFPGPDSRSSSTARASSAPSCSIVQAITCSAIVDLRSAILHHLHLLVDVLHVRSSISIPRQPWPARFSLIIDQYLARHSIRRDLAARGIADHLGLALRGGNARRRHLWQRFRYITFPMMMQVLDPGHRHDLLDHLHLHRFPARLRHHPRRAQSIRPTCWRPWRSSAASPAASLAKSAAILAMSMIPFLGSSRRCSPISACARRKWQQGEAND